MEMSNMIPNIAWDYATIAKEMVEDFPLCVKESLKPIGEWFHGMKLGERDLANTVRISHIRVNAEINGPQFSRHNAVLT